MKTWVLEVSKWRARPCLLVRDDLVIGCDKSHQRCSLVTWCPNVRSVADLRDAVPSGTVFAVKYNPELTRMLVQGASPRVIINESGNAFSALRSSTNRCFACALLPLIVTSVLVWRVRRAAGS